MQSGVGMVALAVKYPSVLRTNNFWQQNHPEMIADLERITTNSIWTRPKVHHGPSAVFDRAMDPYLSDPFRGTVERRVLGPDESALSMEVEAARDVLEAAGMIPQDVDMAISVGFLPDSPGCGNGVYLARELNLRCPAVNLETTCSGALVAFQMACGLVSSGQYRNVMVTVSCTYSIQCEPTSKLSLTSGDGAGAFVVAPVDKGYGFLGGKTINTAETVGAMYFELAINEANKPKIRAGIRPHAGKILRETAIEFLKKCVHGVCDKTRIALQDIDFFVFHTPTAWYCSFCADALGIDPRKTIDTYPLYANTGPALTTGNLFHALMKHRIKPGDLVLLYSPATLGTASAAIVRWTQTALGPVPGRAKSVQ